jgi:hypothetical protein
MADYKYEVQKLYVAYFSRPADAAGLEYWANILATNPNGYQTISANFSASAEYRATYGGMDNRAVVSEVYENLFGRAAEAAGVNYWANLLDQKAITIDNVVTQIAAGAQGSDLVAYNGKVSVSNAFTQRLDLPQEKTAYSGAAANQIAIEFIAGVKDLSSGAAAMDAGVIDSVIEKIVALPPAGFGEETVGLVGVPEMPPMYG